MMITAFSPIKSNTTNFTSNKYYKTYELAQDWFCPSESNKIVKKLFNYSIETGSVPVKLYNGPTATTAGFSTEKGGFGGGWLKGSINTPLSTTDVHTCAILNLVNEDTMEQLLYHVFDKTSADTIEEFIRKIFPKFTRVNIAGGDQLPTINTMKEMLKAVDNINPNAPKTYFHSVCENPQFVAYKGDMFYMKGKGGEVSFVQDTKNYCY